MSLTEPARTILFRRYAANSGPSDIMVSSAGYLVTYPFLETSAKECDETTINNVKGTFNCCQPVARKMVEQKKGSIINLSSMWTGKAIPGASACCAFQAATFSLT